MSKTTLGELKLSPLKEDGCFVFINNEIRMNGKLNKGDSVKIFVEGYELQNGKYLIKGSSTPKYKLVVRGIPILLSHQTPVTTIDELYQKVCELYKNQFYFGKVEI